MSTHLFDAVTGVALTLTVAVSSPALSHIHGRVVAIDAAHGTFQIHHDPFPAMPMAMTMDVAPRQRAVLRSLHVGEIVDAVVDTSVEPWPATQVRPATPGGHR